MKNALIYPLVFLLVFVACKSKKETVKKEETPAVVEVAEKKEQPQEPDYDKEAQITLNRIKSEFKDSLLFTFQRTACFGRCPIYRAYVYPSGYMEYFGEKWVENEGQFKAMLSKEDLTNIQAYADSIGFYQMDAIYDNPQVTDLPSSIIALRNQDAIKVVVSRYNAPESTASFTRYFEALIKDLEYTAIAD